MYVFIFFLGGASEEFFLMTLRSPDTYHPSHYPHTISSFRRVFFFLVFFFAHVGKEEMGSCFSKGKAKGMGEKKSVEGPTVRKDGVPATGVPPSNPISTLKAVEQPKLSTTSSSTSPNLPPPLPSALPVNVAPLENDKRESTLSSPPQSPRQPLSPPPPPPQIETNNSLNEKPVLVASPLPASTPPPMAPTPPPMPPTPPLPRGGMATIAEEFVTSLGLSFNVANNVR
jgi:hypothetical protein